MSNLNTFYSFLYEDFVNYDNRFSLCEKKRTSINQSSIQIEKLIKIQKETFSDLEKQEIKATLEQNGLSYFLINRVLKVKEEIKKSAVKGLPQSWSPSGTVNSTLVINSDLLQSIGCLAEVQLQLEKLLPGKVCWVGSLGNLSGIKGSVFFRDSALFLPDKTLLITAPVLAKDMLYFAASAIPATNIQLFEQIKNDSSIFGRGFGLKNVVQAMLLAKKHGIPFRLIDVAIEGGNCFVFEHQGVRKAIVGITTLCAVAAEGLYKNPQPTAYSTYDSVTDHALYFARNRQHLSRYAETVQRIYDREEDGFEQRDLIQAKEKYFESIAEPFSGSKINLDEELVYESEDQLNAARSKIARALGVLSENISFVEQTNYHIDLEMFVNEKGEVLVNDEMKVIDFLNDFILKNKPDKELKELVSSYLEEAKKNHKKETRLAKRRQKQLIAAGIVVKLVPFCFTSMRHESALNYCNSILVKREDVKKPYVFITTGPSSLNRAEQVFHNYFIEYFNSQFPQYEFFGIKELSKEIANGQGGVHCLSMNTL